MKKKPRGDDKKADDFRLNPVAKKRSPARRTVLIATNVFFTLCLLSLAGAVLFVSNVKKSGEAAEIWGCRSFMIATGSMEPTLAVNGLAITHDDDFNDVEIGDVVAFRAVGLQGRPALHRVVAVVDGGADRQLIVKGDNNPNPDGATVTRENYIGREVWHTNLTVIFYATLHGRNGVLRAVVLPLVILILLYFGARWLIGSAGGWRAKGLSVSVVVLLISGSLLISYALYTVKQVNYTNASLAQIAADFSNDSNKKWSVNGQPIIGRIEISSLKIDYPIIKYQAATSLNTTVAHFGGAEPNTPGNSVLIGHRAFGDLSMFNLFFTKLDQMKKGDRIYLTDAGRRRVEYNVTEVKIVAATDKSVQNQPNGDARELTLIAATYDLQEFRMVRATAEQER